MALEQKILRTQLNPHFIFNALGAIQHYMINNTPEKAALYLAKFSKLMRSILECSRYNSITLSQELDNMRNYLDLQSLRFSKPFSYAVKLDKRINPDKVELPPLILQPILENAIEHGLMPNKGGELTIRVQQKCNRIAVCVEDDGVGIDYTTSTSATSERKNSLGNKLIYERLELINQKSKNKIRFNVQKRSTPSESLSGTKASLNIPIN